MSVEIALLLLCILVFRGCYSVTGYHCIDEACLRKTLLTAYDNHVRPVRKASTHVPVWITITPLKIRELDEKNHYLEMDTWLSAKWRDEYLQWNPNDHHGISSIVLPVSDIWRPDITLYTGSPDSSVVPAMTTNVVIKNSGDVMWVPPYTLRSRCPVSPSYRRRTRSPGLMHYSSLDRGIRHSESISMSEHHERHEDTITCNIAIGSWTLSESLMDLKTFGENVDMTNYDDGHSEWTLETVTSRRVSKYYACCEEPYAHINFTMAFRRKGHY